MTNINNDKIVPTGLQLCIMPSHNVQSWETLSLQYMENCKPDLQILQPHLVPHSGEGIALYHPSNNAQPELALYTKVTNSESML